MPRGSHLVLFLALYLCMSSALCPAAAGDEVGREEAAEIARRWAGSVAAHQGDWAGAAAPTVGGIEPLREDGVLLGWRCRMVPDGWVIVPARRELAPVKACAEHGDGGGLAGLVLDDLHDRVAYLGRVAADARSPHPGWARLLSSSPAAKSAAETVGPLLTTRWHQGWPYNELCPDGDGGRTFVGCTALAAAQLMRYHGWPVRGRGEIAYWWDGDRGCSGDSPGDTLRADFTDPYDWSAMGEAVGSEDPPESRAAVAELCYETAAACRMDFSACGSGASLSRARAALVGTFRYLDAARERQRFHMSDEAWFDLIRNDLDRGLPLLYASTIHTMVCDGWREIDGLRQVHINYGWGGDGDGWFALDAIETSLNPQAERLVHDLQPDTATPIALDAFVAERIPRGARLTWEVGAFDDVDGLHVWREDAGGSRSRLTDEHLMIRETMTWTDPSPPVARAEYWLQAISGGGGAGWHGPAPLPPLDDESIRTLLSPVVNTGGPVSTLSLRLARPGRVRADVVDVRGRRTARLLDELRPVGETNLSWNGRTDDGRSAPSGVYLVRVEVHGRVWTEKVVLAR